MALTGESVAAPAPVVGAVVGWGGLALIVITCFQVGETTPYPGTAALLPVLGTALVVGCGLCDTGSGCRAVPVGYRRCGRSGRLSYSWYLWHWPVLLLAPDTVRRAARFGGPAGDGAGLVRAGDSDAASWSRTLPGSRPGCVCSAGAQPGSRRSRHRVAVCVGVGVVGAAAGSRRAWSGGRGPRRFLRRPDRASAATAVRCRCTKMRSCGLRWRRRLSCVRCRRICPRRWPKRRPKNRRCSSTGACGRGARSVNPSARRVMSHRRRRWRWSGIRMRRCGHPALEPIAQQRHWRLETMGKVAVPAAGSADQEPVSRAEVHRV